MKPKHKPVEVYNALQELGVTQEILLSAIRTGIAFRSNCTRNHPRGYPGTTDWAEVVCSLRNQLAPEGWERNDDDNRPTVVRGDGKIAIAVEIGDENTGNPEADPNLKYHKGEATKRAVNANQGELFEGRFPTKAELEAQGKLTWLLLRYRKTDTLVLSELSLPASFVDGRVAKWADRIILDPIEHGFVFEAGEDSQTEPIDIPIRKRN